MSASKVKRWVSRLGLVAIMAALGLTAGRARGDDQAGAEEMGQRSAQVGRELHGTVTVAKIDKEARTVTLMSAAGEEFQVQIQDAAKLEKMQVGDKIDVTFTETLKLSVKGPDEPLKLEETVSRQPGQGSRTITGTAEVISVDAKANTLTVRGPRGEAKTVHVKNPEHQKQLKTLSPGDKIELQYTATLAMSPAPSK